MTRFWIVTLLIGGFAWSTGCETDAQTGALVGAGGGAAAGAAIDHNNRGRGAMIGAGIGAVTGALIGNESDKAKDRERYDYDY